MIRIRFFGPRELNQKVFSGARYQLKTEITLKASTEPWPEKNQLRVEKKQTNRQIKCATTNKELHNLIRGTPAPRGDGGENGLSSGTSGPIASREYGVVFLTAAKTYKGSVRQGVLPHHLVGFLLRTQDMILFQHRVRRDGQTERVCAEYASMIPIRRKAYVFSFSNFRH